MEEAVKCLSSGKAPGADSITAYIYTYGGPQLNRKLTELVQSMWNQEKIPKELSAFCHRKDSSQDIAEPLKTNIWSMACYMSQYGFRQGHGTIDMIFAALRLQEKCHEQNISLYTIFVDLTKSFDIVSREGLWKIMSKFSCPGKFITMIRQFLDGMQARIVQDGDAYSEPFPVTNGIKQVCVLAPTLLSMRFDGQNADRRILR